MHVTRVKDGKRWRIGSTADVAWIERAVDFSRPVATEVPPVFAAYCHVGLPTTAPGTQSPDAQVAHDRSVIDVLLATPEAEQPWWLGYLEHAVAIDLAFDDAPRTTLFGWPFVLVQAGAEQALHWRSGRDIRVKGKGAPPDLIFPADHAWMLFTSWDDCSSVIGGPAPLIDGFLGNSELRSRTRPLAFP